MILSELIGTYPNLSELNRTYQLSELTITYPLSELAITYSNLSQFIVTYLNLI